MPQESPRQPSEPTNSALPTTPAHAPDGTTSSGGAPSDISIARFQALIRDKYYATDAARGVPGTFMWFIEEVGELATALQDNAPGKTPTPEQWANLEEEFADVLAWLMTLANIAGPDSRGIDIARALEKYTKPGRVEGVKD